MIETPVLFNFKQAVAPEMSRNRSTRVRYGRSLPISTDAEAEQESIFLCQTRFGEVNKV